MPSPCTLRVSVAIPPPASSRMVSLPPRSTSPSRPPIRVRLAVEWRGGRSGWTNRMLTIACCAVTGVVSLQRIRRPLVSIRRDTSPASPVSSRPDSILTPVCLLACAVPSWYRSRNHLLVRRCLAEQHRRHDPERPVRPQATTGIICELLCHEQQLTRACSLLFPRRFSGQITTPSYVNFTDTGKRSVGSAAKNLAARYPSSTIYDVKVGLRRRV